MQGQDQAACRYVHKRLNEDIGWRGLTVVLSDANTPGEGEHKFMQFVREQRARPGWNANTVHCVYGLDADLIHLALASHEPHFYILREIISPPKHGADRARALEAVQGGVRGGGADEAKPQIAKKPFQFMKIAVLREYLELEFSDLELPFALEVERLVDDFVLMCFFVGNDFLPHMPTLDIREKGIELMLKVYRDTLPRLGGYMAQGTHARCPHAPHVVPPCTAAWPEARAWSPCLPRSAAAACGAAAAVCGVLCLRLLASSCESASFRHTAPAHAPRCREPPRSPRARLGIQRLGMVALWMRHRPTREADVSTSRQHCTPELDVSAQHGVGVCVQPALDVSAQHSSGVCVQARTSTWSAWASSLPQSGGTKTRSSRRACARCVRTRTATSRRRAANCRGA